MLDENNVCESKTEEKNNSPKNSSVIRTVFDYVEIFAICICLVFLIFTFVARICTVNGNSMNNTLKNKEVLVVSPLFYEPRQGDIVVFHQTGEQLNEPVVKRIICAPAAVRFVTATISLPGPFKRERPFFVTVSP